MNHSDHQHAPADVPSYDDINTPVILLVGVISAVVTLITVFFVQGLCYHWQNSFLTQREVEPINMPAYKQIQDQKALLTGGDQIVPIDAAMQKVIAKYGK